MWFFTFIDSHILSNPYILGVNSTWSCFMILLVCYWIWFTNIFLRMFCICIQQVGLQFSWSVLIWLWNQKSGGFLKSVWECFLLFKFFWKCLKGTGLIHFLMFGRIHLWNLLSRFCIVFLSFFFFLWEGVVYITDLISLVIIGLFIFFHLGNDAKYHC